MKLETKPIEDCKRVMNASKQKNTDFEKKSQISKKEIPLKLFEFQEQFMIGAVLIALIQLKKIESTGMFFLLLET